MTRRARDEEIATWRAEGWELLEGLIGTDEIDAATADLAEIVPTAEEYFADPEGTRQRWLGTPPTRDTGEYVWPPTGPGFRPEQHRWNVQFPFRGSGVLNRLCVHPAIVDFVTRALGTDDLRLYQASVSARYAGDANYEQPMHTDRNHSWLPAIPRAPWWHVESFLYLTDVHPGNAPTHVVSRSDSDDHATTVPLIFPKHAPDIYAAERAAVGVRGSLLAYRTDVFHRGVDVIEPGAVRFLLNVSYKIAGHEWIGFHTQQSRSSSPEWVTFVEGSTPRELALFGFPPPGHEIWSDELLTATNEKYPNLDVKPWRDALRA